MFRCDVLITVLETGEWEFFLNSTQGYKAFINGDRPAGLFSVVHEPDEAASIHNYISEIEDLTANFYGTEIPYDELVFNARSMVRDYADKEFVAEVAVYYEPLIDAAIAKRDKREITRLIQSLPDIMARAFVMDRLRYGQDKFPELTEGKTLATWFD